MASLITMNTSRAALFPAIVTLTGVLEEMPKRSLVVMVNILVVYKNLKHGQEHSNKSTMEQII